MKKENNFMVSPGDDDYDDDGIDSSDLSILSSSLTDKILTDPSKNEKTDCKKE
jgi:hypothetical protein